MHKLKMMVGAAVAVAVAAVGVWELNYKTWLVEEEGRADKSIVEGVHE